jgi:rod shape-determining protein MreD
MRGIGALATAALVVLLLRSTVLAGLAVRGVVIDVLAFATVMWGLRRGTAWGATFGFAIGLCADLDAAHWMGRHALALALEGYIVGRLSGTLVRDSARAQFVLVLLAVAAHQAWIAAFELGSLGAWPEWIMRVVVGGASTAAVGVVVLGVLRGFQGRTLISHAGIQSGKAF